MRTQRAALRARRAAAAFIAVPLLVLSLLLLPLPAANAAATAAAGAAAAPQPGPPRVALATLVRGAADVLPARVLMRSAAAHSPSLPRVVFAAEGALPDFSARQLAADGVHVARLPGARGPAAALSHARLLGETRYDRLVYLAPSMLVREDLTPLAACPGLCAAFISPCSFSTSVMVLSPNATLYNAVLEAWPLPGCGGGGGQAAAANPDGMDDEDCRLNELFGRELMNAPLFGVGDGGPPSSDDAAAGGGGSQRDRAGTVMRRLPMGCHTPHHLFYPRLRFEVPRETCGVMRVIDFGSVPSLEPWRWYTYVLLNLSWEWNKYREQLEDASEPGSVTRAGVCLRIAATVLAFLSILAAAAAVLRRTHRTMAQSQRSASRFVLPEHVFLVAAIAAGVGAWLVASTLAFLLTPPSLQPQDAFALFAAYKTAALSLLLIAQGRLFCASQHLPTDLGSAAAPVVARDARSSSRGVAGTTCLYALADVIAVGAAVVLLNAVPFGSGYGKLAGAALLCAAYVVALLVGLSRVCMMWLRWGAAHGVGSAPSFVLPLREGDAAGVPSSRDD